MKMVVAVVRDEYAAPLTEALAQKSFGVTKLASTGGFLKAGNTTFMIGVPAVQVDELMLTIQAICPAKKPISGDLTFAEGSLRSSAANPSNTPPSKVGISGAICFVLDVERMLKV
jgi:uncharacterized protein YaaQ